MTKTKTIRIIAGLTLVAAGSVGVGAYLLEEANHEQVTNEATLNAEKLTQAWITAELLPAEPEVIDSGTEFHNDPVGVIEIPKLKVKRVIAEGVGPNVLNDPKTGVGKYHNTAEFGEQGNISLAAHRRANGGAFLHIDQLAPGDEIRIHQASETITYIVTDIFVVEADETWVLRSTPGVSEITLISCHPVGEFNQRLILKAEVSR